MQLFFYYLTKFSLWELKIFLVKSWIWLLLWISLILHEWCVDQCFGVVDVLARSMFWCWQWCGAVNVLALLMFWPGQYFITVDVLVQLHICRRLTIPEGPQISTLPVHWVHQNRPHRKINHTVTPTLLTQKASYFGTKFNAC